jgi:hypothetical protein
MLILVKMFYVLWFEAIKIAQYLSNNPNNVVP